MHSRVCIRRFRGNQWKSKLFRHIKARARACIWTMPSYNHSVNHEKASLALWALCIYIYIFPVYKRMDKNEPMKSMFSSPSLSKSISVCFSVFFCLSGKNRRLSSIFDSCWRNEVSDFRLRQFEQVVPFCEHYGADIEINTRNSLDNSGSNDTMQKVLALIVRL